MEANKQLKPFDRVLVRDYDDGRWFIDQYGYIVGKHFVCMDGVAWSQCIPYEGNEALLGTTDSPKEKKPTFKAGDVLSTFYNPKCIFIYEGMNGSYTKFYALLANGSISYHGGAQISGTRHATEEEKAQLIEAMHSSGKNFDFNKLEVVPWKWKPEEGEKYYVINPFGEIEKVMSFGERSDVALCRCGNCFGSKAEAKASALYRAYDREEEEQ